MAVPHGIDRSGAAGGSGAQGMSGLLNDLADPGVDAIPFWDDSAGGFDWLDKTESWQFGSLEIGHATDTTLTRTGAGDIAVEGNALYRAGGTDVPVADGGTGVSTLADGGILVGNAAGVIEVVTPGATTDILVGGGAATAPVWTGASGSGSPVRATAPTLTSPTFSAPIIDGSVTGDAIALQAEMETGVAVDAMVTPGRQQFHPSAVKGWVNCGIAADINASYNVTSIVDDGTGFVSVNWATDFSSINYFRGGIVEADSGIIVPVRVSAAPSTGTTLFGARDTANNATDPTKWNLFAIGDQ